jgi:hypothetical protein
MMELRPISFAKAHPVGVLVCIGIGYGLARYGSPVNLAVRLRGGGSVGGGDGG